MIILCSTDDKLQQRWRECLEGRDKLAVCTTAQEFLETTSKHQDSMLLLHLNFPQMDNAASITTFIQNHPSIKVIACADIPADEEGLELLKCGVFGYANTWMATSQLELVIEQVRAGEVWVGRNLILRLINDLSAASQAESEKVDPAWQNNLTQREREVAKLIGTGNSNKRIANELDITERTVKAHLSAIFRKTACNDRIQLALLVNQSSSPQPYSKLGN